MLARLAAATAAATAAAIAGPHAEIERPSWEAPQL